MLECIKVFYLPTDAQEICFKRILKFTLKQLLHVSVPSLSSGSALFKLAEVMVATITSASLNKAIPNDGDCTKTCRGCFNVNLI